MDAGGARHAGPPRTLDVQQFAGARSREVQALCDVLAAQQAVNAKSANGQPSSSSLTTPRHLRRRTASHNRRRPFRWIRNGAQSEKKQKEKKKAASCSSAALSVEEESSLKRKEAEKRTPSRRVRRRIELQGVRNGRRSCMRDGTRRLATHVWHAKRFAMKKVWGYCLPEGLPGRGRGSKALFKWVKDAAVLHDASYMGIIELQGTADAIMGALCKVLEPSLLLSSSASGMKEEGMRGLRYGNAVLHNVGKSPHEAIAPVCVLWRPSTVGVKSVPKPPQLSGEGDVAVEERQLWIWVHPSAFDSALEVLSTACEIQGEDAKLVSVKCQGRQGEFARLDLLGSRALQVLQKVLRPAPRKLAYKSSQDVTENLEHQSATTPVSSEVVQPLSWRIFAKADCLPMAAVLALNVCDPRDTPPGFFSAIGDSSFKPVDFDGMSTQLQGDTQSASSDQAKEESVIIEGEHVEVKKGEPAGTCWGSLLEDALTEGVSDCLSLWSLQTGNTDQTFAALSQKALSEKRHKRRKTFFGDVNRDLLQNSFDAGPLDSMLENSRACPVLLLKLSHVRPSASGWSLIMPITWVHAFWVPLIFAGGHVIGLRERHWLATDAGISYFPHDFPDCTAHVEHLVGESAAFEGLKAQHSIVSPVQRSAIEGYKARMPPGNGSAITSPGHQREQCTSEKCSTGVPAIKTAGRIDVLGFTKMDDDTAMIESCSFVAGALSSPGTAHREKNAAPEFTNMDQGNAIDAARTTIYRPRLSRAACHEAEEVSTPEFTKLVCDTATNEAGTLTRILESQAASKLQQTVSDAFEQDQHVAGGKASIPERDISEPAILCNLDMLGGGNQITQSIDCCQSFVPAQSSTDGTPWFEPHFSTRSRTDVKSPTSSFFVARTMETVKTVLKDSGFPHALLLCPGMVNGGVRDGLRQGRLKWHGISHAAVEPAGWTGGSQIYSVGGGHQKVCYVRILLVAPGKGVMKESGLLCSPIKEDFEAFLERSQHWRGISVSWVNRQAKDPRKKEGTGRGLANILPVHPSSETEDCMDTMKHLDDEGYDECCKRKTVGFISSTGPQGRYLLQYSVCTLRHLD